MSFFVKAVVRGMVFSVLLALALSNGWNANHSSTDFTLQGKPSAERILSAFEDEALVPDRPEKLASIPCCNLELQTPLDTVVASYFTPPQEVLPQPLPYGVDRERPPPAFNFA
jgi:hypothetical protein